MDDTLTQFHTHILPFFSDWKSIDLRVVGLKVGESWFFNAIIAELDHRPPTEPTRVDLPSLPELIIAHERWDMQKIGDLLESLSMGELVVKRQTIKIKQYSGSELIEKIPNSRFRFIERNELWKEFDIDYTAFVFNMSTTATFDPLVMERIDHKLRSNMKPWDGIVDLRENFVGIESNRASMTNVSHLLFVAPIKVRIHDLVLDESEVRITVESPYMINYQEIRASIIAFHRDGSIERLSSQFKSDTTFIKLSKPPLRVTVIVNYRDIAVDRAEMYGGGNTPRLTAFTKIYGEIDEFISDLKTTRGHKLEGAVALLFHLLGFNTANYGYDATEKLDIIAFSDSSRALVIECTQREPDLNNKLTKLTTRSREVDQAMDDISILPVMITGLPRSLITKTDRNKAARERVSLITQDEFPNLIQMALNDTPSKDVYDYLSRMIPLENDPRRWR